MARSDSDPFAGVASIGGRRKGLTGGTGMRRWNGWGNADTEVRLPEQGAAFLAERLGAGQPLPDADLSEVLARVPASRLPEHPLLSQDAEIRVRHARGQ